METLNLEKGNFRERLVRFINSRRGHATLIISLFIIVFGAAGTAAYYRYFVPEGFNLQSANNSILPNLSVKEVPKTEPSTLDGTEVDPSKAKIRPLAVMIENHPDARPQAGLIDASVVFEVIVEGGITRFMAIFGPADAQKIGPVRSARPYFVHYAAGYKALYTHAGGSQAALALIPKTPAIVDLPHTAAYFEREPKPGIAVEHTLFTSSAKLYEFAKEKEVKLESEFTPLKFADDIASEQRAATATLAIDFSTPSYKAEWVYEREENIYKRSLAGAAHIDRVTGDQITAKNIAVIEVERVYDAKTNQGKGEWFMTTEGEGKSTLIQNGTATEGKWKKSSTDEMLRLYDSNGNELTLIKGKTWFEVIPPGTSVTHTETPPLTATGDANLSGTIN
ncbi:DUF3048 domain-containing protein [Candidatus Berkelbacteria bacterium]|nr:DUF3048 domain-containing protein [Candidatus Berkelbacteria bacterium]